MTQPPTAVGRPRRVGRARRQVLEAMQAAGGPITAEELAEQLPEVHVSSVYRSLAVLEEDGVLVHVHLGHGPAVYALAADARDVRHLVCQSCDRVVTVPAALFEPLEHQLAADHGFVLGTEHFALVGRCVACASAAQVRSGSKP